ncbi:MAG: FtsW/RodA/SpoVE family cell cycle protein, partial [Fidelibacterota bacterium]
MGTIIMFSASSPYGEKFGSSLFFLKRHIIALLIGTGMLIVLSRLDYHIFKYFAVIFLGLSILLVIAGYFFNDTKDASRWLIYSGSRKMITTSDFMKYSIIVFTAYY